MKRLFVIGNDAFTVHAMRFALRYTTGVNLFGIIDGKGSLVDALGEAAPDVIVVDGLSDTERALDVVQEVRSELADALIVLVTAQLDGDGAARALEAGTVVCLWRDATLPELDEGQAASHAATAALAPLLLPGAEENPAEKPNPLTARELEILRWVAEGHTNARIARKLWVTEQTVKFHLSNIYKKLGVQNRTEASHYAVVNDLFETRRRSTRHVGLMPVDGNGSGSVNGNGAGPIASAQP